MVETDYLILVNTNGGLVLFPTPNYLYPDELQRGTKGDYLKLMFYRVFR